MITDFDTSTWIDPWVQELSPVAKLLFIYLWTNSHRNLAGLYAISYKTIRHETGLTEKQTESALSSLSLKVKYDSENQICWVINFVKRQFLRTGKISPKVISGIEKALLSLPQSHFFISEFLEKYSILQILYPYPIERVSGYPTSKGKGEEEGKGEGKRGVIGGNAHSVKNIVDTFSNSVLQNPNGKLASLSNHATDFEPPSDDFFEKLWDQYPPREGKKLLKKDAKEYFLKSIKETDWQSLESAVAGYKDYCYKGDVKPRDMIRFLRNDFWKDFIAKAPIIQEPKKEEIKTAKDFVDLVLQNQNHKLTAFATHAIDEDEDDLVSKEEIQQGVKELLAKIGKSF